PTVRCPTPETDRGFRPRSGPSLYRAAPHFLVRRHECTRKLPDGSHWPGKLVGRVRCSSRCRAPLGPTGPGSPVPGANGVRKPASHLSQPIVRPAPRPSPPWPASTTAKYFLSCGGTLVAGVMPGADDVVPVSLEGAVLAAYTAAISVMVRPSLLNFANRGALPLINNSTAPLFS